MKIGFAGIGIMGAPMALNLIRAGHELHIYSRSGKRCEALIAEGAVREDSPAAAASACDVFISIVSDTPDVEEVLFGDGGASETLRPDTVAIDMSTISPRATAEFAERLGRKRVALLDAPVSGGEKGAINATLSIMVGGDRNAFDRCLPIFQALGKTIVYAGPSGFGQKTKLVNQVVGALNILATVEGLRLAKASGLDLQTTIQAVGSGAAGSWSWNNLGPKISVEDMAPGFMIKLQQKDMRLASELLQELGLDAPGTQLTLDLFTKALQKGFGDLGNQALARLWE
jgi:3-hydroxyisobutyrate dehydrogenase